MSESSLSDQIQQAAQEPAKVRVDGASVEAPKLAGPIEADRYLAARQAALRNHRGLAFTKLVPPGGG